MSDCAKAFSKKPYVFNGSGQNVSRTSASLVAHSRFRVIGIESVGVDADARVRIIVDFGDVTVFAMLPPPTSRAVATTPAHSAVAAPSGTVFQ